MHPYILAFNAFLEDTCVLFVAAYLLTRGPVLRVVFPVKRRSLVPFWGYTLLSGLLFGVLAATEFGMPNLRYPYDPTTLFVAGAVFLCDPLVGAIAVFVLLTINGLSQIFWGITHGYGFLTLTVKLLATLASAAFVRQIAKRELTPQRPWFVLAAAFETGSLAQATALGSTFLFPLGSVLTAPRDAWAASPTSVTALFPVFANGLGVALLQVIVRDAHLRNEVALLRAEAIRHAAEAEQARAFAAEHQLAALRARIHPHFLFNTLTSIAALCSIAPDQAEKATVRLGELMHRVMEKNLHEPVMLHEEIRDVEAYLDIEHYRLGNRLHVKWNVDDHVRHVMVPPFSLMTLVENAITHGIAARPGGGTLCIEAHECTLDWLCVAVRDDGAGMTVPVRQNALCLKQDRRTHGLRIMDDQLRLLFGKRARVRLFSQPEKGTLALFCVPLQRGNLGS